MTSMARDTGRASPLNGRFAEGPIEIMGRGSPGVYTTSPPARDPPAPTSAAEAVSSGAIALDRPPGSASGSAPDVPPPSAPPTRSADPSSARVGRDTGRRAGRPAAVDPAASVPRTATAP